MKLLVHDTFTLYNGSYRDVPPHELTEGVYEVERVPSPLGHDCFWIVLKGTKIGATEVSIVVQMESQWRRMLLQGNASGGIVLFNDKNKMYKLPPVYQRAAAYVKKAKTRPWNSFDEAIREAYLAGFFAKKDE